MREAPVAHRLKARVALGADHLGHRVVGSAVTRDPGDAVGRVAPAVQSGAAVKQRLGHTPGLQTFTINLTGVQSFQLFTGNSVLEPASWALMILGFGEAGVAMRRRRTASAA